MLAAKIPTPPIPNVIEIGPAKLHLYGLLIGIGIVLAIELATRLLKNQNIDTSNMLRVMLPSVLMGFVGARVYHVISEPVRYANAPGDILKVWNGGLGIYGGVLFGTTTAYILSKRFDMPRARLLDAGAPAIMLAQAIGRWGNYLNQELFGRPTDLPWAVKIDPDHRPEGFADVAYYHPTFLYESIANLTLCVVLVILHSKWKSRAPGAIFGIYIACYAAYRFLVEGIRIDTAHEWLGLRQNQWVSGAVCLVAISTVIALDRKFRKESHQGLVSK